MDIATFETADEFNAFGGLVSGYPGGSGLTRWVHVGGVTVTSRSATDWYWVNTNEKINYTMSWNAGQPDNSKGTQYCLAFDTVTLLFDDHDCYNSYAEMKFICQTEEFFL